MPYIKQDRRDVVGLYSEGQPLNSGELNFQITSLLVSYFDEHGGNYQAINDVLGALEGAKLEFYRRVAAPYEDRKIAENGDVL
jgi:hypothetical protein